MPASMTEIRCPRCHQFTPVWSGLIGNLDAVVRCSGQGCRIGFDKRGVAVSLDAVSAETKRGSSGGPTGEEAP